MFENERESAAAAADELDRIWDAVNADTPPAPGSDDATATASASAAFASYLNQLAPTPTDATRERMKARVLASQRGEAEPMSTSAPTFDPGRRRGGGGGELFGPLPQQIRPRPSRLHHFDHPAIRIAATILLALAIGGSWVGLRGGGSGPEIPPTVPAHGALMASPQPGEEEVGFRETVLLHDVAATGAPREFMASLTRITLAPGALYDFAGTSLNLDPHPISFYVESGTLTVEIGGEQHDLVAEQGENAGVPVALENRSDAPVTFIQLVLHQAGDILPTPPDGANVTPLGDVPVAQPLGSVTTVNFSRTFFNTPDADPINMDGPEGVAFIAINSGSLSVEANAGAELALNTSRDFTPASGQPILLEAGDTLTANRGSQMASHAEVVGGGMMSAYVLTLLNQTPVEVANQQLPEAVIDWTIPADATSLSLILRTITLQPNTEWSYTFDGVTQYQGISGTAEVEFGGSNPATLTAGTFAAQSGSGEIVIRNTGSAPATLIQASIAPGEITPALGGLDTPDGITTSLMAVGTVPATPGAVTIHLAPNTIETGSTMLTDAELGASLIAVIDGDILFTPKTADVIITRDLLGTSDLAAVEADISVAPGSETTLSVGDAAIVPTGAAYTMTGPDTTPSSFLWLFIEPAATDATPTPAPAPNSAVTVPDGTATPTPAS